LKNAGIMPAFQAKNEVFGACQKPLSFYEIPAYNQVFYVSNQRRLLSGSIVERITAGSE